MFDLALEQTVLQPSNAVVVPSLDNSLFTGSAICCQRILRYALIPNCSRKCLACSKRPLQGRTISGVYRMPTPATGGGRYLEWVFRQSLGGCGLGLMLFGDFHQGVEISWGRDGHFAEHLAVDFDVRLGKTENESAVINVAHSTRCG